MQQFKIVFWVVVVFLALLVLFSGCAVVPVSSRVVTSGFGFYQIGVTVHVVNNCAPFLDFERAGEVEMKGLPYGSSGAIHLTSLPFSGSDRRMSLTVKGYGRNREYLGSMTKTFYVNTHSGSREEVWEVDSLRLPGGRGGCR